MIYNVKSLTTGEMIAFTIVSPFDSDCMGTNEILETRLEAAMDDGVIPDDEYVFVKMEQGIGVKI